MIRSALHKSLKVFKTNLISKIITFTSLLTCFYVLYGCFNSIDFNAFTGPTFYLALSITISVMFRILRFLILTISLFNISLRKVVWIYINSMPFIFLFPYKFGEIFKIIILSYCVGDFKKALMLVLSERLFDSFILMIIGVVMYALPSTPGVTYNYSIFKYLILLTILVTFLFFVILPSLSLLRRFIFLNYVNSWSSKVLETIVSFISIIGITKNILFQNFTLLFCISGLIWIVEIGGFIMFLQEENISIYNYFFRNIESFVFRSNWIIPINSYVFINIVIITFISVLYNIVFSLSNKNQIVSANPILNEEKKTLSPHITYKLSTYKRYRI